MRLPNASAKLRRFWEEHPQLCRALFWLSCRIGNDPRPPQLFNFVGGKQYEELGRGHFLNLRAIGGVSPDDRILDVGCGIGRVALHFADFVSDRGSYDGFDIVRIGIEWCNARIARKRPNFRFVHLDIRNKEYNPDGVLDAASVRFPYDDEQFTFVFATSVMTHLLPEAAGNYLEEISRVLIPGGRSVVTFFVINSESRRAMTSSAFNFQPTDKGYWSMTPDNPEGAIAYDEETVLGMYRRAGLEIPGPIRFGTWSGRAGSVGGQDYVLASRP